MLSANKGQIIKFKFNFNYGTDYYDPLLANPVQDIYVSVIRGSNGYGNIIENAISIINSSHRIVNITGGSIDQNGYAYPSVYFEVPHSYVVGDQVVLYGVGGNYDGEYIVNNILQGNGVQLKARKLQNLSLSNYNNSLYIARLTKKTKAYIERISQSEYNFIYSTDESLYPGMYTLVIKTNFGSVDQTLEINFEILNDIYAQSLKVFSTKIENNIATIYTVEEHNFDVGDYISVSSINKDFNGNYYVTEIPSNKSISFPLYLGQQQLTELSPYGTVKSLNIVGTSPVLSGPNQPTKISYRPKYDSLQPFSTNSILLIGHADGLELNNVVRIQSIQEAITLIGADGKSPLLRGVLEAYNSGAKDIFICATAPMSEYIDSNQDRNEQLGFLLSKDSTPQNMSFYEKYYERLNDTYSVIKYYEFIDIVVPLEASIINTGLVDFCTQLAVYLADFHNTTGFVQIGIIGSRSNGIKDSDINELESNPIFRRKFTTLDSDGQISSDIGRFVVPIYGELNFNHVGFPYSYTGTAAAAFAGILSTTPVYNALIRKRIPSAYSVYGTNLSRESLLRLENLGINTVYRSRKSTRGYPYEVYVSNDYTMAAIDSIFSKLPQVRLAAMVINEIKSIGFDSIGKFAYESVLAKVRKMLDILVASRAIRDYSLDAYVDKYIKGVMIFQLSLVSTLNLKNIQFSVSAGPGA